MGSPNKVLGSKACIGYLWKAKVKHKRARISRSSGSGKGYACKATALERYMATKSRSYKHPLYGAWCLVKNGKHISRKLG